MENRIISFSGGKTSGMMTINLCKLYPDATVIFCNTGKEKNNTLKFVDLVDKFIGNRVVWLGYSGNSDYFTVVNFYTASRKGEPFEKLIKKRSYLPNVVTRFCTQDLKIRPLKKYAQNILGWKHWDNYVGIRYDEPNRWQSAKSVSRNEVFDVVHPLVDQKITKQDVENFWLGMPFTLELQPYQGNCDLCFLKGINKRKTIIREDKTIADWWIRMENLCGSTFDKQRSVLQIRDLLLNSPELPFDDTIECFCNSD